MTAEVLPIYNIAAGKYDLTVSVGPGFNTRREEAATQMIEAARAFPGLMEVAGDLIAKNLDWPGASDIADRLSQQMEQRQQGGQPQADPAEMAKVQSAAMEAQAKIAIDQEKVRIDGFKAQTERMKVENEIRQPSPLPVPAQQGF